MQKVRTSLSGHLGIGYPVFGFTHDIATVAATNNAEGYGFYRATRRVREELTLIPFMVDQKTFWRRPSIAAWDART